MPSLSKTHSAVQAECVAGRRQPCDLALYVIEKANALFRPKGLEQLEQNEIKTLHLHIQKQPQLHS